MPRPVLKRKDLIGAQAIVEEAVMIIVPPPIGSAEAKKSAIPFARKSIAQEGYFIGCMLPNVTDHRAAAGRSVASHCWADYDTFKFSEIAFIISGSLVYISINP